jgi:hypothetical protein
MVAAPAADAARRFRVPLSAEIPAAVPTADAAKTFEPATVALKSEPAKIDLAKSEPAVTVPAESEPAQTEPVKSEPAEVEPVAAAVATVETAAVSVVPPLPEEQPEAIVPVAVPVAEEPAVAASTPSSDLPWWLSEAPHLPAQPQRPAVIWEPARMGSSREKEPALFAPVAAEPQAEPAAATPTWVPAPAVTGAAEPSPASQAEEPQENLASRLSGLRSLLFVLGVKESKTEDEARDRAGTDRAASESSGFERLGYERTVSPPAAAAADWAAGGAQGASPRLVTAAPEVLPPRPIVIDVAKLDETKGESSTRQDRRASFDGIEILPSKRGQYKKV